MSSELYKIAKRGGTVLTLAAVSCAKGTWDRWHALCPQFTHPAGEIVDALRRDDNAIRLAGSVSAARNNTPTTPLPDYLASVEDAVLDPLGNAVVPIWPPANRGEAAAGAAGGLAALAIAYCRNMDVVNAVATRLSRDNGHNMIRMARLAAVTVDPGEPSRMKKQIRTTLQRITNGPTD